MVELPEANRIVKSLENRVQGLRIQNVRVLYPKSLKYVSPPHLIRTLTGARITGLGRRGKVALFFLDNAYVLLVSFGMTGKLLLENQSPRNPHQVLSLKLVNGTYLNFYDARKFGKVSLSRKQELDHSGLTRNIGIEFDNPALSAGFLASRVERLRKKSIKEFLLDQRFICGIGNIYANEILFDAKIDPRRLARSLGSSEFRALIKSLRRILHSAIAKGGTTFRDFVDANGAPGNFGADLKVFMRNGAYCPRCGEPHRIKRITLGQRSTFFCETCQK